MNYRNALITGASSGLGRGLAVWFASRGVKVYAAARRVDRLRQLEQELGAEHLVPVELDVSDPIKTAQRVAALDEESGGLDLVIANAGVGGSTSARRMDWPKVLSILQTNVMGAAATLSAALPGMVERGRGHLVGISSLAAFRGLPKSAGYSASKAFLATYLESLRVDLRRTGVKVTTVFPGFVKTELTADQRFQMPMLLEADDAVNRIGKAIVRAPGTYRFPWPMSLLLRVVSVLPDAIYDRVVGAAR